MTISRYMAAIVIGLLAVSAAAWADESNIPMVQGEIRKIDVEQEKITIRHGPLAHLNMDMDMTMVFRVAEPDMLEGLNVGDQIWFRAERVNGALTVTAIGSEADAADSEDSRGDAAANEESDGHGAHAHEASGGMEMEGGHPGSYLDFDRTIELDASDIAFDVTTIDVKDGETVRFLIRNSGELEHEFNVGTTNMHRAHEEEMAEMMDALARGEEIEHVHGNSVIILPGETRVFVWTFAHAHDLQFACNVPGHYEAGMYGNFNFVH